MNFEEFRNTVAERLAEHLPEDFCLHEVRKTEVLKNNGILMKGISVSKEGSAAAATVYLESYFEQYVRGLHFNAILDEIAELITKECPSDGFCEPISAVMKNMQDRVVSRLVNAELNKEYLEDHPHILYADLAEVFDILVDLSGSSGMTGRIHVTVEIMEREGLTVSELHELAVKNGPLLRPMRAMFLKDIVKDLLSEKMEICGEEEVLPGQTENLYVISNSKRVDGAGVALYPEFSEWLAENVGDCYLLPSSVHEWIAVKKDTAIRVEDLLEMVREVNRTQVLPEEKLSDGVYEFVGGRLSPAIDPSRCCGEFAA